MKKNLDFFKVVIILFMIGLFFILYRFSENGRYQTAADRAYIIIDTRTGNVYEVDIKKEFK